MQLRYDYYKKGSKSFAGKTTKEMTDEEKTFKRRFYWRDPPISAGICNTIIWNTVLHS